MPNMLSGSGMPSAASGNGPAASLQGTLGTAPQQPSPNLLAGAGQPQGQPMQPQLQPPSKEQLMDVAHRTSYVNSMLKGIIGKPNLSPRDVIDSVGNLVAEQIMDPFMAAKYLTDLPTDTPQVRQWVAKHYVASRQSLQSVSEMLEAHGKMTRAAQNAPAPRQQGAPIGQPVALQGAPAPNMLSGLH